MIDEARLLKKYARMCNAYTEKHCEGCPLNADDTGCLEKILEQPMHVAMEIVKWDISYPETTLLTEFLKKYPKAKMNKETGIPDGICPRNLGMIEKCPYEGEEISREKCKACWNTTAETEV